MSCATLPGFLAPHPSASFLFGPSGRFLWKAARMGCSHSGPLPLTELPLPQAARGAWGRGWAWERGRGRREHPEFQKGTCTLSSRLVLVCMKLSHTQTTLRNQPSPFHPSQGGLTPPPLSIGPHLTNLLIPPRIRRPLLPQVRDKAEPQLPAPAQAQPGSGALFPTAPCHEKQTPSDPRDWGGRGTGRFPGTVRGRRGGEVSGPAKCPLDRSPEFFLDFAGPTSEAGRGVVPDSAAVRRLAAGSPGEGDSAGVSPLLRAAVRAVLDRSRRRAPNRVPTPRPQRPPLPALGARGPSSPTPPAALARPSGMAEREARGGAWGCRRRKRFVGSRGVESVQAPLPPLGAGTAPPRGRSRHLGAALILGPQTLAEQNAFRSLHVPRDPPSGLLAPPLSVCPTSSSFLPIVPSPFPRSFVLPFSLPSLRTPPLSFVFLPHPRPLSDLGHRNLWVHLWSPRPRPRPRLRPAPPGSPSRWPGAPSGVCACSLLPTAKSSKGTF